MAEKHQVGGELSLIGGGTVVRGSLVTEGSIRIDGTVAGDVVAKIDASIGPSGVLEGKLNARNVTLAGRVKGTITANEKLILESKSVLHGDIIASKLVVDEGALFDGHCKMTAETVENPKQ